MRAAALALGFVLVGSADWQLVASRDGRVVETMCAKSAGTCEAAVQAIRRGWFAIEHRDAALECRAAPGCFSPESEVIPGYNDATRGRRM